jgi:replication factor C subunit 1
LPVDNKPKVKPLVALSQQNSMHSQSQSQSQSQPQSQREKEASLLWVEKYKPTSFNKIIGQNTEKSNANKLLNWLKNWQNNHLSASEDKSKPKKSWNGSNDDQGGSFKAALLSGPPGIGKTTTAQLACKEAGYTYIELNASDSRSKKILDKVLGQSLIKN